MRGINTYFIELQPVAVDEALEGEGEFVRRFETVERGQGWWVSRAHIGKNNWEIPQLFTVNAIHDNEDEGEYLYRTFTNEWSRESLVSHADGKYGFSPGENESMPTAEVHPGYFPLKWTHDDLIFHTVRSESDEMYHRMNERGLSLQTRDVDVRIIDDDFSAVLLSQFYDMDENPRIESTFYKDRMVLVKDGSTLLSESCLK